MYMYMYRASHLASMCLCFRVYTPYSLCLADWNPETVILWPWTMCLGQIWCNGSTFQHGTRNEVEANLPWLPRPDTGLLGQPSEVWAVWRPGGSTHTRPEVWWGSRLRCGPSGGPGAPLTHVLRCGEAAVSGVGRLEVRGLHSHTS